MSPNMLRSQAAHAIIHFAPIRCAAEEHGGHQDPQPARIQQNQFSWHWNTKDEETHFEYAGVRASIEHLWAGFEAHLKETYDGVAVIQAELGFTYRVAAEDLAHLMPSLVQAINLGTAFEMTLRRSIPPVGTVHLTVTPTTEKEWVLAEAKIIGHPGSPSVSEFMSWLDQADGTLESTVARMIVKQRQDTPYPWAGASSE